MVYIRIKHGEHEIEIRGEQDYVQGQLEQFYISIENHERLIRTMQGTDYHGEKRMSVNDIAIGAATFRQSS